MNTLLDHNFYVYTSTSFPNFSNSHVVEIEEKMANFFYHQYLSTTADIIPKYKSVGDLEVEVNCGNFTSENIESSHVTINHGSKTQRLVFITNNEVTLFLINSRNPEFLIHMVESLDVPEPILCQPSPIVRGKLVSFMNSLNSILEQHPQLMGDMDLTFSPKQKLTNDLLKEIIINVNATDSERLIKQNANIYDSIVGWLKESTTLDFTHLNLMACTSNFLSVSKNGRIRISSDRLGGEAAIEPVITSVLEKMLQL